MALAIALVVALITLLSVYAFWAHIWWLPINVSTHGGAIDHQFMLTLIMCGVIFVLAQLGLGLFVWKYRDKGDGRKVVYSHGNNTMEVTWTAAAAIVFTALNLMGYRVWAGMHFTGPAPGALRIEVQGQQFAYYFRYPGPDGLDRQHDGAARDDIVTATLAVPVNRPVELILRSKDVNHSFYVRELRLQQDLLPGLEVPVHFTATVEALQHNGGKYDIVCTQLCGLGHYKMHAYLQVMTEEDFEKWLQIQASQQ